MPSLKNTKRILLTVLVFGFGISIGFGALWVMQSFKTEDLSADVTATPTVVKTTQSILPEPTKILTLEAIQNLEKTDDIMMGSATAPITIIEFSDFQCTYCKKFFDTAFALLKTTYIDTGKVRLVYKHFPIITKHPQALSAGKAFECAAAQNTEKAWSMHDIIFEKTKEWSGNEDAETIFHNYASEIGLETTEFSTCMDDPATEAAVMADLKEGRSADVTATPSFIITSTEENDAKLYKGALSFVKLQAIISSLSKE